MRHPARSAARRLRLPVAVVAGTALALGPATAAFAHIHADPPAVAAGEEATVSFGVEHGCGESPTTKVEIQLPEGSSGISGVDDGGFTSSVDGMVVTFEGGPLDAETEQDFAVTFTAPDEAGDVPVKIIQTCEEGELDWIEVAAEGEAEPEHPAPILAITEGTPTGEEGDHHAEEGGGTDHHAEETATTEADHHAEETETTEADHHAEEGEAAEGAADADGDDDGGSSSLPWILGGVATLAIAGGGAYLAGRNKGAGPDAPDSDATA